MKVSAGKVLMFVENAYPNDTRVRNEAEALTEAGYEVTVVGLRRGNQPATEMVRGVRVYRLPRLELFEKTKSDGAGLIERIWCKLKALMGYACEYLYFTNACFLMSIYIAWKHGFDVIHAHNPPDTLWMVALPWRLVGKKYVYDHHDLCPELYRSRYRTEHDIFAKGLQAMEWMNLQLANVTVATNESYRKIQMDRGGRKAETIFVVRNGPSHERMQIREPSPRLRSMGKKILVYIGSLNPQDGVDYLIRAIKHLVYDLNRRDFHCVVMGDGDSLEDLRRLAKELNVSDHVELTGYISDQELQENLSAADLCMDPDPSSPLNDVSTWIKIMEYMAYEKAIVSFDLKETRYSAQDAAVFVPCNDEFAFAEATARLMDDDALRAKMGRAGRLRVEQDLQWSVVRKNLVDAYAFLGMNTQPQ